MKSSIPNAYEFSRLLLTHSPAHVLLSTLRGLISQAPTGKPICIGYVPVKQSVFLVSCSKYFLAVFCFSLFSIFNSISYAAEKPIGVVLAASGEVNVVRTKKTFALKRSERLFSGDRIITALNSRVQLKFVDRSIIALKQDSELSIDEFVFDAQAQQERSFYTLVRGGFRAVSGKIGKTDPADYAIKTPIATLGIRGTFYDAVLGDQLYVGVMNGKVAVENSQGELLVGVDAP
ncbi:MAG: FecR family protein, partial [Pseudomonadota bacterium]